MPSGRLQASAFGKARPLNAKIATGLMRVLGERLPDADWLTLADELVMTLSGDVSFVAKDEYERESDELRKLRRHLGLR